MCVCVCERERACVCARAKRMGVSEKDGGWCGIDCLSVVFLKAATRTQGSKQASKQESVTSNVKTSVMRPLLTRLTFTCVCVHVSVPLCLFY